MNPTTNTIILGKRKYEDAFEQSNYDDERFGQNIEPDFFRSNIGHGIYQPESNPERSKCQEAAKLIDELIGLEKTKQYGLTNTIKQMVYWCEKYNNHK
jgi:hypothetical protein